MKRFMFILLATILCFSLPCGSAEVYTWTDDKGVKHYSDAPPEKSVPDLTTEEKIVHDDAYYDERGNNDAAYWESVINEHREKEAAAKIENQQREEARAKDEARIREEQRIREIENLKAEIEGLRKSLRYYQKYSQGSYAKSARHKMARARHRLEELEGKPK